MEAALVRNARIRDEGTRNLVRAAKAAGVKKIIAQSIAFVYAPDAPQPVTEDAPLLDFAEPAYGETARAVHSLEQQITTDPAFIGVVLRYGCLYARARALMRLWTLPHLCTRKRRRTRRCWRCNARNRRFTTQRMTMRGCLVKKRNASWGLMRGFGCKL